MDFLKSISAAVNSGLVEGPIDKEVELLEIEPLHTTINGNALIIQIEPADLTIDSRFTIGMTESSGLYGRAEGLAVYSHTRRTISLRFKMIKSQVLNGREAVTNNAVVANLLQQLLYPAYTPTGGQNTSVIKTPPFFRIQYGDLIGDFKGGQKKGLPGYFSNLDVGIGGGGYGSSIGDNFTFGVGDVKIPIEYTVSMAFNVLHDHIVGWYDGKFAGDGRNNWPLNTGVVINSTLDGPGFLGGNPGAGGTTPIPGSTATVVAQKEQRNLMEGKVKPESAAAFARMDSQ